MYGTATTRSGDLVERPDVAAVATALPVYRAGRRIRSRRYGRRSPDLPDLGPLGYSHGFTSTQWRQAANESVHLSQYLSLIREKDEVTGKGQTNYLCAWQAFECPCLCA